MALKHAVDALLNLTEEKKQRANKNIDRLRRMEEFAVNNNVTLPDNYESMPELELTKYIKTQAELNSYKDIALKENLDMNIINLPEYQNLPEREKYLKGITAARQSRDLQMKINAEGVDVPDDFKYNIPELQKFYKAINDTKRGINTPYFNLIQENALKNNARQMYHFFKNNLPETEKENFQNFSNKFKNDSQDIDYVAFSNHYFNYADKNAKNELDKFKNFAAQFQIQKSDQEWEVEYQKILNLQNPEQTWELIKKDWENEFAESMKLEIAKNQGANTLLQTEQNIAEYITENVDLTNPESKKKAEEKFLNMGVQPIKIQELFVNTKKQKEQSRLNLIDKFNITDDDLSEMITTTIPFMSIQLTLKDLTNPEKMNDTEFISALNKIQNFKNEKERRGKILDSIIKTGYLKIDNLGVQDLLNPNKTDDNTFYTEISKLYNQAKANEIESKRKTEKEKQASASSAKNQKINYNERIQNLINLRKTSKDKKDKERIDAEISKLKIQAGQNNIPIPSIENWEKENEKDKHIKKIRGAVDIIYNEQKKGSNFNKKNVETAINSILQNNNTNFVTPFEDFVKNNSNRFYAALEPYLDRTKSDNISNLLKEFNSINFKTIEEAEKAKLSKGTVIYINGRKAVIE